MRHGWGAGGDAAIVPLDSETAENPFRRTASIAKPNPHRCAFDNRRGDLRYRVGPRRSLPRTGAGEFSKRFSGHRLVCPGDDRRTVAGDSLRLTIARNALDSPVIE